MMNRTRVIVNRLLLVVLLSAPMPAMGEEGGLTVFYPERVLPPAMRGGGTAVPSTRWPGVGDKSAAAGGGLTLRGTLMNGNGATAILAASGGEAFAVRWRQGEEAPIKNHGGYFLIEVNPRQAKVRFPSHHPCLSMPEQGVTCESSSVAILSLLRLAALPTVSPPTVAPPAAASSPTAGNIPSVSPPVVTTGGGVNPFQVLLENQRRNASSPPGAAAQSDGVPKSMPKRIEAGEAPPGMKVLRTPFGDRLAPAE